MSMIDYEDITKEIVAYLRETKDYGLGVQTRLNYNITLANNIKGDTLLNEIPDEDDRYVLFERVRDMKNLANWIDLSLSETTQINSNFDTIAKTYTITISSLLKDDVSNDTYFRSLRMIEVLKNIMNGFFKETRYNNGFLEGYIDAISVPNRVMVDNSKTIRTSLIYIINIW